jgi:hypothetical protein
LLLVARVGGARGFHHLHLVPLAVEQAERRGGCQLGAHAVAKVPAGEQHPQRITVQAERRLPARESLDRIRRLHREVHRQRAARHLANQRMAALVGGGDRIEVVEHRLRIGAVMQERGHHHRAAAVGGERLEKRHGRVTAFGQHIDAVTARAHRGDQRAHLVFVGQPGGHRQSALAVVRGRRAAGKTDGAGLHRFADEGLHLRDFRLRGRALRRVVAHHVGADAAVSDVSGDVDHAPLAPKLRHVLGERLEFPCDALPQHVQRHALDLREVAHRDVAVLRLARRDRESAIADHRRSHAERRRRPDMRIPSDLGVEVGVAVDDARHQRETVGCDHLACRRAAERGANRGDEAVGDGNVVDCRGAAGAVIDQRVAEEQAVHHSSPVIPWGFVHRAAQHADCAVSYTKFRLHRT